MAQSESKPENRIALFQQKLVRRAIHNNEWWFVITDVVAALTDSVDAPEYLKKLRKRDPQLAETFKGGTNCPPPWPGIRNGGRAPNAPMLEYRRHLPPHSIHSHVELIFSMLGEAATTEISCNRDAQGFPQNQQAARSGGKVAGKARQDLERKSGRKVVTSENYLGVTQSVKAVSDQNK